MNKAFVREPDSDVDYCPRCGSPGQVVSGEVLANFLSPDKRQTLVEPANFCPSPRCEVVYFDAFERAVLTKDLEKLVYPKDPDAPLCACFGLTRRDVERDVAEGVVTRVRAVIEKSKSPDAQCAQLAANGQSCTAYVQKCYIECRTERRSNQSAGSRVFLANKHESYGANATSCNRTSGILKYVCRSVGQANRSPTVFGKQDGGTSLRLSHPTIYSRSHSSAGPKS